MNNWNPLQVLCWVLVSTAIVVTLLLSVSVVAAAEDDSAKSLLEQFADAQKRKDEAGLVRALGMAPQVHNASDVKAVRGKILSAVAKVAKNKKAGAAQVRAVEALGQMNDAKSAFKTLKGLFPKGKKGENPELAEATLAATGRLAAPGGVPLLRDYMNRSKETSLRRTAIEALGAYGQSPQRVEAAKALLDALAEWKKKSDAPPKAAAARAEATLPWEMLAPTAAESLKQLTGTERAGPAEWLEALAQAKGKVAALFPPAAG